MSVDLSKWREEIRALEKGGEHLLAYDLARQALDAKIDDPQLKYLAVRNLVRLGAVLHARRLYRESGLREMRAERAGGRSLTHPAPPPRFPAILETQGRG